MHVLRQVEMVVRLSTLRAVASEMGRHDQHIVGLAAL